MAYGSKWLDDGMDTVTVTSLPTLGLRLLASAFCVMLSGFCLGWAITLPWTAALIAAEVSTWITATPQRQGLRPTARQRLLYFLAVVWTNLVWWSFVLMLWFPGTPGLRVAAICLLAAQMAHGQAHARGTRMLEHVVERLLHQAQHVQGIGRLQPVEHGQILHVPVEHEAAGLQALAQAVAHGGKQSHEVVAQGLQ